MAHLLSIISDAVTKVAGIANAATSVFNTVSIAPSFINSRAIPATGCNGVVGVYANSQIQKVTDIRLWKYLK